MTILAPDGTAFASKDELTTTCEIHRRRARMHPLTPIKYAMMVKDNRLFAPYRFRYGKFRIAITYEVLDKREWHAQVGIMEDLNELQFGATEQGLLAVESWNTQDFTQAEEILGECLAPVMKRREQRKRAHKGLMFIHLFVEDEDAPLVQEVGH